MTDQTALQLKSSEPAELYSRFFESNNDAQWSRREPVIFDGKTVDPKRILKTHLYLARFFQDEPLPDWADKSLSGDHAGLPAAKSPTPGLADSSASVITRAQPVPAPSAQVEKKSLLTRLKSGLRRTRTQFTQGLDTLFSSSRALDQTFFDDLEAQLILADVGVSTTESIIQDLKVFWKSAELEGAQGKRQIKQKLQTALLATLAPAKPTDVSNISVGAKARGPEMIIVVGVNGVGKTTTIGKLAQLAKNSGKSVMLAAGDTFRAAAVEQLQIWGQRVDVPVVTQGQGADSASVIYDALQSAQAKGVDLLIADTAGRLHNKSNLMKELQKIVRVVKKLDPAAPHKVLLVVDGCTGQNALSQGREFNDAVALTGLVVTKLDGTAKGGILFALSSAIGVPVEFIGIGEAVDDLKAFDGQAYVETLLDFDND